MFFKDWYWKKGIDLL